MKTISNILREAFIESGLTLYRASLDTGINRACLRRFRDGLPLSERSMDFLAEYLGYTLTPVKRRGETKKES